MKLPDLPRFRTEEIELTVFIESQPPRRLRVPCGISVGELSMLLGYGNIGSYCFYISKTPERPEINVHSYTLFANVENVEAYLDVASYTPIAERCFWLAFVPREGEKKTGFRWVKQAPTEERPNG
jgi:hypothetical protein